MRITVIGRILLLCFSGFFCTVVPASVVLPAIPDISASIAPESLRAQLESKKLDLLDQRKALHARVDALRDRCRGIETDSERDRQCHAEKDSLETEMQSHANAVLAFKQTLTEAVQARIDELHKTIHRDEEAVQKNLGFAKRGEDLETWQGMSASAQTEFEQQTQEALKESSLALAEAGVQVGIKKLGSLSPPVANRWITQLKAVGVTNTDLFDAIRAVAQTSGKPEMAEAVRQLIDRMKMAQDLDEISKGGENAKWKAAATGLSLVIPDPRLNALAQISLQDARFLFYSVNNNITRRVALHEVDRITSLNEEQLKVLHDSLFPELDKHVKQLHQAKLDLQLLTTGSRPQH